MMKAAQLLLIIGCLVLSCGWAAEPVRVMAVGDSITEGGKTFATYREPLARRLQAAGYAVEFVGSRGEVGRRHEGYGGKTVEYLAEQVPAHFAATPAAVVLLHAGHNHFSEQRPVPGIVAATEKLITLFRAANPRVTVLLAQVIPSGKLPKYDYIPELNLALSALAVRLNSAAQPVVLVNLADGFDWRNDTIEDHVHPNAAGADKMAARWFEALRRVLPPP
jgi:lysophospholipase L1-like esterase